MRVWGCYGDCYDCPDRYLCCEDGHTPFEEEDTYEDDDPW